MRLQKRRLIHWAAILVVSLQAVLGTLPVFAQGSSRASSHSAEARKQMEVTLEGEAIAPNLVRLSFTAIPSLDAPAVQVKWTVENARLVDGANDETLGAVAAGASVQETRSVAFPGPGVYRL